MRILAWFVLVFVVFLFRVSILLCCEWNYFRCKNRNRCHRHLSRFEIAGDKRISQQ